MKIDEALIRYLANLARLSIKDEEVELFKGQLTSILALMEELNQVDTEGVEETAHVLPLKNVVRPDVVVPSRDKDDILSNAPSRKGDCFEVPKII